jgi:hypothetical protein
MSSAPPHPIPDPGRAIERRELGGWMAAMLAIAAVRVVLAGGPQFFNDSYQYLSIAENLRRHGAIETSIVHFDEERARNRLPAPETTFPPGYSLLIWSLSWTGLPPEWVGLLVSLASAIAVLPLLRSAAAALGSSPAATRLSLGLWAFGAQASLYGITLYAEAAFTAVSLAAVVLLLGEVRRPGESSWRVPAGLLLAGAAVWLRYAGLFLVAALHAYAAVHLRRGGRRRLLAWAGGLAACDAVIGLLVARNLAVAGVWSGGNSRPVHPGAAAVLHNLGVSAYELALGSIQDPRSLPFGLFAALLVAGAVGLLASRVAVRARTPAASPGERRAWTLLALCAATYCAAMAYAGLTTQISLSARMFVPVLPLLFLLASRILVVAPRPGPARAASGAFTALFAAGYLGANLTSAVRTPEPPEHRAVAEALRAPMQGDRSLLQWMEVNIPRDAVVLSVDGQATGYLLKRNTISTVGRLFTRLTWNEEEARAIVSRFGATYVIVYPEVVSTGGIDRLDSPLLRALAARRPPPWLELAAENPRAMVYRTRAGAAPAPGDRDLTGTAEAR